MAEALILSYTDNLGLIIISAIAFLIRYVEYIYSFRLVLREKSAPFPVWMHTFYFAHDLTACIVFFRLAQQNNYFWFFTGVSAAMVIWIGFEIFSLYMAIKVERIAIWGKSLGENATVQLALKSVLMQIVIMLVVVNIGRFFMDDAVMFKWFFLARIVMVVGPGYLWAERCSRKGASIGLSIVIFIGSVNICLPPGYGMWTTAFPYFNNVWFYTAGIIISLVALRNVFLLLSFPNKPVRDETGRHSIW